jgi:hypothetical protein
MASFKELYAAWYIWRPAHPKKRKGAKGDKGFASALLALPFRPTEQQTADQFGRLERRAPQVMVKVTKPTFGAAHTFQNMTYIARHCEEEIFDQDGSLFTRDEELERLADDWHQLNQDAYDGERRYRGPDARRLQFSMPPGTDPVTLRNAVSATARHVFGDRYDYVFALHTDRPHPHVHLTVRAVGHDGKALRINKDDLLYLRRALALELRMRGIEADATPQVARGARRQHERTEVHRARVRRETRADLEGRAGEGGQPGNPPGVIDPYVQRVYEAAARRLRAGQDADAADLARRIERFTAERFGDRTGPEQRPPQAAGPSDDPAQTDPDRIQPQGERHGPKQRP